MVIWCQQQNWPKIEWKAKHVPEAGADCKLWWAQQCAISLNRINCCPFVLFIKMDNNNNLAFKHKMYVLEINNINWVFGAWTFADYYEQR